MHKKTNGRQQKQEQNSSRYRGVDAHYTASALPSYQGNPLIEALPPIHTREEASLLLRYDPGYNEQDRQLSAELRLQLILNGIQFLQPLISHLELEQLLSRMLRSGYLRRNPIEKEILHFKNQQRLQATAQSCPMIGFSGTGKTAAINAMLALYDQIINHSSYCDQPFTLRQVTWMKLECSHDGSLSGFCKAFFKEVDRLLETNTYEVYIRDGRRSIDNMLDDMATIAAKYCLGVLVIDNIQNLREAKGNNITSVLNFLGHLSHHLGISVILVGTPKALPVLSGEFFGARRVSGQGIFSWNRMQEDVEWNIFTEALWKYQYVRQPIPLSNELRHTLYEESQGIADLAIKVYMLAQIEAITHTTAGKEEVLTKDLLHSVAQNRLRLVQPFLNALRSGEKGIEELEKYGGSAPVNLEKVVQEAKVKVQEAQNEAPTQSHVDKKETL